MMSEKYIVCEAITKIQFSEIIKYLDIHIRYILT